MQQALDALKYHTEHTYPFHQTNVAIELLKKELAKPEQAPIQLRRGDRLRPIDADDLVCTVWATSTTGKTLVKWGANEFCEYTEYTAEQIGELFWLVPRHEQEPQMIQIKDGQLSYIKKPWVGLTDKEMESLVIQAREVPIEIPCDSFTTRLLKLAEAKLKDKNTTNQ